jgi:hypothetical protein
MFKRFIAVGCNLKAARTDCLHGRPLIPTICEGASFPFSTADPFIGRHLNYYSIVLFFSNAIGNTIFSLISRKSVHIHPRHDQKKDYIYEFI